MRKVLVSVILLAVLGWTIYDTLSENEQSSRRGSEQLEEGSLDELIVGTKGEGAEQIDLESIGLQPGESAPDFTLTTLSGEQLSLSDLRGKKVILNFWATWCGPCRAEMPDMQKFYESHQDEVEILAVNVTESEASAENVDLFVEDYGLTFPILLDEKSQVVTTYQALTIPTSYLIDSNGVIQNRMIGPMNYDWMKQATAAME